MPRKFETVSMATPIVMIAMPIHLPVWIDS